MNVTNPGPVQGLKTQRIFPMEYRRLQSALGASINAPVRDQLCPPRTGTSGFCLVTS
jgi:hypothetical protein